LVPPCGCSSLELVCHEFDMLFLGYISHVKELLYFVDQSKKVSISRFPLKEEISILSLYSLGLEYSLYLP